MHQGHNIPWTVLSTNFKFVELDKRYTPPFTGLISQDRPGAAKDMKYFSDKFMNTIHTFSETERAKYPATFTPIFTGNVFSDELREKYPKYLNPHNQRIEYWMLPHPAIRQRGLADVIKILLYENEMETLLMLAQHPIIQISELHNLQWGPPGDPIGFSRVKGSAAHAYIFFNCAESTGILANGKYALMREYYPLIEEISGHGTFSAHAIPHVRFLEEYSAFTYTETGLCASQIVHGNYGALQDYLKTLFALMYRYDVLMRECGLDSKWEKELTFYNPLRRQQYITVY